MRELDKIPVIAIDGPSASGKGTVAQRVAWELGFHYLDSGSLYRVVALAAKKRGVAVTAGVTPAHFMLSDNAMADFRTFARLSPPLRCESDRRAVIAAIADGTIDVIASGHDPRGPEDKRLPFAEAEPGVDFTRVYPFVEGD